MSDLLSDLSERSFIIVSGKGGVGKTTFSAALALKLAEMEKKTLIVSIDPAHSLGDVFDMEIGSSIKCIAEGLHGLEFDPLDLFTAERRVLVEMLRSGPGFEMAIPVDDEMLDLLIDMHMPYEFAEGVGFIKLFHSLLEEKKYDVVVFDTAPTGHTFELLRLPEILSSLYGKLIKFRLKVSRLFSRIKAFFGLGGDERADMALSLLEETKKSVEAVRHVISDPRLTEFVVVTIPNDMAILESIRLIEKLYEHGIPNRHVVVNFVRIYSGPCKFSNTMARFHLRQLERIKKEMRDKSLWVIPYFAEEIRGLDRLKKVCDVMGKITLDKAMELILSGAVIE